MTVHVLKCDHQPFSDTWDGKKRAEVRKDDRGYAVDDTLKLVERRDSIETGRVIFERVTHIQSGYGLPDDLCVLSVDVLLKTRDY
jgi:hypothetical protein